MNLIFWRAFIKLLFLKAKRSVALSYMFMMGDHFTATTTNDVRVAVVTAGGSNKIHHFFYGRKNYAFHLLQIRKLLLLNSINHPFLNDANFVTSHCCAAAVLNDVLFSICYIQCSTCSEKDIRKTKRCCSGTDLIFLLSSGSTKG